MMFWEIVRKLFLFLFLVFSWLVVLMIFLRVVKLFWDLLVLVDLIWLRMVEFRCSLIFRWIGFLNCGLCFVFSLVIIWLMFWYVFRVCWVLVFGLVCILKMVMMLLLMNLLMWLFLV